MFKQSLVYFCLSLLMTTVAWAQCNCADCSSGETISGDGVYHNVVGGEVTGSSDGGSTDDWDHEFYSCSRKTLFNTEICDSCCQRPYISVFGAATTVENFFRDLQVGPANEEFGANLLDGYSVGGALGLRIHQQARVEIEYSYRFNRVENLFTTTDIMGTPPTTVITPGFGRVYSHAGMFNTIYDFSRRRVRCPNLYIGGGIGVLTIDAIFSDGVNTFTSDDSQFAFQFIGGVNYVVSEKVELFGEYRFLGANDLDVFDVTAGAPEGDFDYHSHNFFFGLRYQL